MENMISQAEAQRSFSTVESQRNAAQINAWNLELALTKAQHDAAEKDKRIAELEAKLADKNEEAAH